MSCYVPRSLRRGTRYSQPSQTIIAMLSGDNLSLLHLDADIMLGRLSSISLHVAPILDELYAISPAVSVCNYIQAYFKVRHLWKELLAVDTVLDQSLQCCRESTSRCSARLLTSHFAESCLFAVIASAMLNFTRDFVKSH